jgi:hypothetical protein
MHDRGRIERCTNSRIGTHILEDKVFEMIRETMLDPARLRGCIDAGGGLDDKKIARKLARVAENIGAMEDERRRLIDRYAAEEMTGEEYIAANRALDAEMERLIREKARLAAALRSPDHEDFIDASVRHFCATAKARWCACTNNEARRQFLLDFIEGVIFDHYKITVFGAVPVETGTGSDTLPFRIKDEINKGAVSRGLLAKKAALEQANQYLALHETMALPSPAL